MTCSAMPDQAYNPCQHHAFQVISEVANRTIGDHYQQNSKPNVSVYVRVEAEASLL